MWTETEKKSPCQKIWGYLWTRPDFKSFDTLLENTHMFIATSKAWAVMRALAAHLYGLGANPRGWAMCLLFILFLNCGIVIRGGRLWRAANIKDAAVCVGSSLKLHKPLFSVHKLWPNKLMRRFYWSISSNWLECYWTLCTVRSTKIYHKRVWRAS